MSGAGSFPSPFLPLKPSSHPPSFYFFALVPIPCLAKGVSAGISVLMLCFWLGIFHVAKKNKVRLLIIGGSIRGTEKLRSIHLHSTSINISLSLFPLSLAPPLF